MKCPFADHKYHIVWNIHSFLILDNAEMKNSTELICVAISRGEAALSPSSDAFSTTKPQKQFKGKNTEHQYIIDALA